MAGASWQVHRILEIHIANPTPNPHYLVVLSVCALCENLSEVSSLKSATDVGRQGESFIQLNDKHCLHDRCC
jgi:hypothetical protein